MKKHSMFLERAFTVGKNRLVYVYQAEEYRIRLQRFKANEWIEVGIVANEIAFDRIEPVWVFLVRQNPVVWRRLRTK